MTETDCRCVGLQHDECVSRPHLMNITSIQDTGASIICQHTMLFQAKKCKLINEHRSADFFLSISFWGTVIRLDTTQHTRLSRCVCRICVHVFIEVLGPMGPVPLQLEPWPLDPIGVFQHGITKKAVPRIEYDGLTILHRSRGRVDRRSFSTLGIYPYADHVQQTTMDRSHYCVGEEMRWHIYISLFYSVKCWLLYVSRRSIVPCRPSIWIVTLVGVSSNLDELSWLSSSSIYRSQQWLVKTPKEEFPKVYPGFSFLFKIEYNQPVNQSFEYIYNNGSAERHAFQRTSDMKAESFVHQLRCLTSIGRLHILRLAQVSQNSPTRRVRVVYGPRALWSHWHFHSPCRRFRLSKRTPDCPIGLFGLVVFRSSYVRPAA